MLDHLRAAPEALPQGRRGSPVRGRDVAEAALVGAGLAYRRGLVDIEGTAASVITAMWERGLLKGLRRCPHPLVCEQAVRLLIRVSPLFVRVRPGCYRLVLVAYRPDVVHADRLEELRGLQTAEDIETAHLGPPRPARGSRQVEVAFGSDPCAASAAVAEHTPVAESDLAEAGPILVSWLDPEAPSYTRAAILSNDVEGSRAPTEDGSEHTDPAALAGSVAADAFGRDERREPDAPGGRAAPTSPSRGRLRRFTPSGWLQAVPKGKHVRRLANLLLRHLPHVRADGSARELVERLAGVDGRWTTRRERYGLVRALEALLRRGLVEHEDGVWRLPELSQHPALRAVGLASRPGERRPTEALFDWLARLGFEADGLSHGEAVLLQRRLWAQREAVGWSSVGTILRLARQYQRERLPVDLRQLGEAADRRSLEAAMAEHLTPIWGDC